MSKETSSTIFKKLVNSPVGIIAEFIVNKLAAEYGYEPLRNYFLEIQTGKTPPMSNPEYYASNDIEWIKPSDIGGNMILSAKDFISKKAVEDRKATIYKPNTVLFNCIGNLGRLGLVKKIASSNQQITGVLFKDQVYPEFVYYHFLTKEDEFYKLSSQTTLPIINQKGLGNLDFTCPNISVQKEVVRFLEYCKECLDDSSYPTNSDFKLSSQILDFSNKAFKAYYTQRSLLSEYENQLTQLENLNQAILQEAVQGKLVNQDNKDEPASELLKRIKAEKAKSGKKEKPLPPIKTEEIPFEIPENWVWCRLGEITDIQRGSSPRPKGDPRYFSKSKTNFNWITISDISNFCENNVLLQTREFLTAEGSKHSRYVDVNEFIIAVSGSTTGKCCITGVEGFIYDGLAVAKIIENSFDSRYLLNYMMCLYTTINNSKTGASFPNINTDYLNNLIFPLPPIKEQIRINKEIEKQFAKTKQIKEHIIANQQATEQLLKALLHQAFEVEEIEVAKPKGKVIELKPTNVDYYRRTVLAAEIVWQLHKEPTLGHLKLQKLIYLCQKSADMQLPTNFLRQAMGPYDNRLMRSIDKQLKEKKWFEYKKEEVFKYQPLEKAGQHHNDFIKYFSAESESIQFIIDKFKKVLSKEIEIWATLYACLDEMLNEKMIISETLLIKRFYEWSKEKEKFNENEISRVFSNMKDTGIMPKGYDF